ILTDDKEEDNVPRSHRKGMLTAHVAIEIESSSTTPGDHVSGHDSVHDINMNEEVNEQPEDDAHKKDYKDEDDDAANYPTNDTHVGVSRDNHMDVKDVYIDPMNDALEGAPRDDGDGHGMELVVYRGHLTTLVRIEDMNIHEHIKQAIKCILNGMEERNRGITEPSEHLELKIFTDNQKENLMFLGLDEIKTHLRNISTTIKQTLLSVANIVRKDMKTFSKDNHTRFKIMELKAEQSGMEPKHLFEQKFL
ncbi:hypothetical protein Dimus_018152, partial [Dionaea muscipula]